ncbi:MAG: hypothetical protein L0I02_00565 [Lactobacillus sp.]|nr:hypothetical protein [Lactobacillus sp.]MDN6052058.1 hypothetical protein [Lactobacillus sp.]
MVGMLTTALLVVSGFKISEATTRSVQPVLADTVTKAALIKGTLTKALEGPSGHVYPVGTEVAKVVFGTVESDPSTPYYLSLTSDAEGNINALGEIPARYVQSSNNLQDVTDQKSTTLLNQLVNDFMHSPDGTTDGTNSPGLDIGNGDESSFTVYTGDLTKRDTSRLNALLNQAHHALAMPSSYTAGLDALQAAVYDADAVLNDKQMSQDGIDLVSDEVDQALNGGDLVRDMKYVSGKKAKSPKRRTRKAPARKVTHKRRKPAPKKKHKKVVKKVAKRRARSKRSSRKVVKKAKKSKKVTHKAKKHIKVKRHK